MSKGIISQKASSIQNRFIVAFGVMLVCILPFILNIFGVDFSSNIIRLDSVNSTDGQFTSQQVFSAVAGAIHHVLLEWSAVTLAFMAAFASFVHYRIKRDVTVPIIGLAMLFAGSVDAFHTLAATRIISASAANTDFIPFTWALSRTFNATIMLMAAGFSLWVSKKGEDYFSEKLGFNFLLFVALLFALFAVFSVFSAASSQSLPQTMFKDAFISRPYDILPLALFLCSAVLYGIWYNEKLSFLRLAVLLSMLPEIVTQLHMAFGSTALFDNHFNIAHFLKIIAYGTVFVGILFDFSQVKISQISPTNLHKPLKHSKNNQRISLGNNTRSLAIKIPIVGFLMSLTIAMVVGLTFYIESQQLIKKQQREELRIESKIIEPLIKNFYRESGQNLLFLSKSTVVNNFTQSLNFSDEAQIKLWSTRLEKMFAEFIKMKSFYKSISYFKIDNPIEVSIRVEKSNGQISASSLNISAQRELLKKLNKKAIQNSLELIYSEVQPSLAGYQQSKTEQSFVFVAVPLVFNKHNLDIIVVELDFNLFIRELKMRSLDDIIFYLANNEGQFIFNSEQYISVKNKASASQTNSSFTSLFNNQLIPKVNQIVDMNRDIPTIGYYSQIAINEFGLLKPLNLLIESHAESYINTIKNMRYRAFLLGLSLAILSLGFSIVASRRLIRPLTSMIKSVGKYEDYGVISALPISEQDEIGVLARSFHNLLIKVEMQSTQQKNETIKAEDASARLRSILDSIADAVINIDDKGIILAFNLAAEKIFGYQSTEVMGQNIRKLMPNKYGDKHDQYLHNYLTTGITKIIGEGRDLPALRKNGQQFSMHLNITKVNTSEGVIFTGLIRDVTEQKALEAYKKQSIKEVKDLAWRLEFALTAPKIGVWDLNIKTKIEHWDKRMFLLYGFDINIQTPNEQQVEELQKSRLPKQDLANIKQLISTAKQTGEDLNFQHQINLPDESIRYIESHARVLKDDQGDFTRIVGTSRDITEQHHLQVLKQNALDIAENALRLRSEFLASMSHEIRTPMNGVLGMLSLLEQSPLNKQQAHHLQLASSSANSLLVLINDILDFSKIEAGKLDLEILDFDIRSQLGDFAESMAVRAQQKSIELILDVSQISQSMVRGDPSRIRQILSNLVGNAIKFTSSGEIVISAEIKELNEGLQLCCEVADTGIGIDEDKLEDIFDSFTQVDATTTRKYGGTGLGLAIVRQLCQLMGGDIQASSCLGQGSSFTFTLNLQKSSASILVMPEVDISNTSILIVDDNSTNLAVLRGQLSLWGADVVEAESGFVALDEIEQHEENYFSIAILDMQMPQMDGAMLGAKIKNHAHSKKTKLIMMTSMDERGDAGYFAKLGFSAYFPKPATTSDLFDALSVLLDDNTLQRAKPLVTKHNLPSLKKKKTLPAIDKTTRILLVEDNRINQAVILGVLSNIGLSADVAGNGVEALAALNGSPDDNPYQLIIMDCQMPEMDGYEATIAIRKGKAKAVHINVPIIAMTANAMVGDKEKCLECGMSDYTTKPVNADIIHEKIAIWVGVDNNLAQPTALISEKSPKVSKQDSVSEQDKRLNSAINAQVEIIEESLTWDKSAFLKRIRNNKPLAQKLISLFIKDIPEELKKINEAIVNKNSKDLSHLVHKLKGSARNLSGDRLADIAQNIELKSSKQLYETLIELSQQLESEFTLLKKELMMFLAEQ